MEAILRIQPFDFLTAILWASVFGWGFQSGAIRQIAMAIAVYAAAIAASGLYHPVGSYLADVFGRDRLAASEWGAYVLLYFLVFGGIAMLSYRVYPNTRVNADSRLDSGLGALIGALWSLLLVIALATILRFYVASYWPDQAVGQASMQEQMQHSIVVNLLENTALWGVMAPWFPSSLPVR